MAEDNSGIIRIGFLPVKFAKFDRDLKTLTHLPKPEEYYAPFIKECMMMLENKIMQTKNIRILERKEIKALDAERIFKLSEYTKELSDKAGANADILILPESAYFKGRLYIRLKVFRTSSSKLEKTLFEVDFRAPERFVETACGKIINQLPEAKDSASQDFLKAEPEKAGEIVAVIPATATSAKYNMSMIASEVSNCIFSSSRVFKLVDRTKVKECIKELKLSESSVIDKDISVKIGGMLGARFIALCSMRADEDDNLKLDLRCLNSETGEVVANFQKYCQTEKLEEGIREFLALCEKNVNDTLSWLPDDNAAKRKREIDFLKKHMGRSVAAFLETDTYAIDLHLALLYMANKDWNRATVHLKKLARLDKESECDEEILNCLEKVFRARGLLRLGTPLPNLIGNSQNKDVIRYFKHFVEPESFVDHAIKTFYRTSDCFGYKKNKDSLYTIYYLAVTDPLFTKEQKKQMLLAMARTFVIYDYKMLQKSLDDLEHLLGPDDKFLILCKARVFAWYLGDYEKGAEQFARLERQKRLDLEQISEYALLLKHLGNSSEANRIIKEVKQIERETDELKARKKDTFTDEELEYFTQVLCSSRKLFRNVLKGAKKYFAEFPEEHSRRAYRSFIVSTYIKHIKRMPLGSMELKFLNSKLKVPDTNVFYRPKNYAFFASGETQRTLMAEDPGKAKTLKELFSVLDKENYFELERQIILKRITLLEKYKKSGYYVMLNIGDPVIISLWYDAHHRDNEIEYLENELTRQRAKRLITVYLNRHETRKALSLISKYNFGTPALRTELEKLLQNAEQLSDKEYWQYLCDNELIFTSDGELHFVNLAEKNLLSIPCILNEARRNHMFLLNKLKHYVPDTTDFSTTGHQGFLTQRIFTAKDLGQSLKSKPDKEDDSVYTISVLNRLFAIDRKNRKVVWRINTFDIVDDYFYYHEKTWGEKTADKDDEYTHYISRIKNESPKFTQIDDQLFLTTKYDRRSYACSDGHLIKKEYLDPSFIFASMMDLNNKNYITDIAKIYLSNKAREMLALDIPAQSKKLATKKENNFKPADKSQQGTGHYGEEYANKTLRERPWLANDLPHVISNFYNEKSKNAKKLPDLSAKETVTRLCMLGTDYSYEIALALCEKNPAVLEYLDCCFIHDDIMLDKLLNLPAPVSGISDIQILNMIPTKKSLEAMSSLLSAPRYSIYTPDNLNTCRHPEITKLLIEGLSHINNHSKHKKRYEQLLTIGEQTIVEKEFRKTLETWTEKKYLAKKVKDLKDGVLRKEMDYFDYPFLYLKHDEMYKAAKQFEGPEQDYLMLKTAFNGSAKAYTELFQKYLPLYYKSYYIEIMECITIPHPSGFFMDDKELAKWFNRVKDKHYLEWFFEYELYGIMLKKQKLSKLQGMLHYVSNQELEQLLKSDEYNKARERLSLVIKEFANRGDYHYCTEFEAKYLWQILYGFDKNSDPLFLSMWWDIDRKAIDWLRTGEFRKNGSCPR